MATVKVGEAIRRVQTAGWRLVRTKGRHRQFHHPTRPGRVTIAGQPSDDLAPKTWARIREQAGIEYTAAEVPLGFGTALTPRPDPSTHCDGYPVGAPGGYPPRGAGETEN